MFSAVLLMLYVAHLLPQSIAMLARPLDMFTITFRVPFSSSGRNVCAMSAGPMTFAWYVRTAAAALSVNAVSSPSFCEDERQIHNNEVKG